jgi:hypothetical protein
MNFEAGHKLFSQWTSPSSGKPPEELIKTSFGKAMSSYENEQAAEKKRSPAAIETMQRLYID